MAAVGITILALLNLVQLFPSLYHFSESGGGNGPLLTLECHVLKGELQCKMTQKDIKECPTLSLSTLLNFTYLS